jgi:dipeptide/tripeptide permease
VGFLIAALLTVGHYALGWSIRDNLGNLIFAVLLIILGVQFVMTGLLAEIMSRVYFKTHDIKIYSVCEVLSRRAGDAC